jgi:hypothetical protein
MACSRANFYLFLLYLQIRLIPSVFKSHCLAVRQALLMCCIFALWFTSGVLKVLQLHCWSPSSVKVSFIHLLCFSTFPYDSTPSNSVREIRLSIELRNFICANTLQNRIIFMLIPWLQVWQLTFATMPVCYPLAYLWGRLYRGLC